MATPDKSLRRLVAKMGVMAREDVDDILAQLESDQRDQVLKLLSGYLGRSPPAAAATAPLHRDLGLSPWLAARLSQAGDPAFAGPSAQAATAFRITEATARALADCAATLPNLPGAPVAPSSAWLTRLLDRARAGR